MRPGIPLLRTTFTGALLGLLLGPGVGQSQVMPKKVSQPAPGASAKLLPPAELEIMGYRVYDTQNGSRTSASNGKIDLNESLSLLVSVRNNGGLPGSFDYALGTEGRDRVYWKETGTDLKGGGTALARFDISLTQLNSTLSHTNNGGLRHVCLGLWLLKRNLSVAWTDANNPNHQRTVCFDMWFYPG